MNTALLSNLARSWGFRMLIFIMGLICLTPFLVGDTPMFCFKSGLEDCENGLIRPIAYNPYASNSKEKLLPPLSQGINGRHWMGTDHLGRDVAARWLVSLRQSFFFSLLAGLVALLLGSILGAFGGYYKDNYILLKWWLLLPCLVTVIYMATWSFFALESYHPDISTGVTILLMSIIIELGLLLFLFINRTIIRYKPSLKSSYPVDKWVMGLIELFETIPPLFVLLGLLAVVRIESSWTLAVIVGCIGWMTMARFVRAESLGLSEKKFIQDFKVIGVPDVKIILRHILPNALMVIALIFSYSIAAFISLESFLSFLGIGIPKDYSSWGQMINTARRFPQAWWLGLFPGLGIFMLIFSFQKMAADINPKFRKLLFK